MALACSRLSSAPGSTLGARALLVVVAVLVASSGSGGAAADPVQPDPTFTALSLDGRTTRGRLVSLGPGVITLASEEGARHELPLGTVFKITREAAGSVTAVDRSMVVLPEGDRLTRVALGAANETSLEVQSDALGKLSIPLESILGWIMVEPSVRDDIDLMWDRLRLEPRKDEVVWLSNGDRLTGSFLGFDRTLKLLTSGKPREIEQVAYRGRRLRPGTLELSSSRIRIPRIHVVRRNPFRRQCSKNRRRQYRSNGPLRSEGSLPLERARRDPCDKSVVCVFDRAKAGPRGLLVLRGADPRVPRRPHGRRPLVLVGRSNL